MAGLFGLLNIANDGLTSQSFGLNVTGQNVSNANTPQYMRRIALLETQTGPGVKIQGQRQVGDIYADRALYAATGLQSSASELDGHLAAVENVFNDTNGTGLGSVLSDLFNSFQKLSATPADPTVRQSVLGAAERFTSRSNEISGTLAAKRSDLYKKAMELTTEANQKSAEVAKLNQQIVQTRMNGRDASGLIDQRNQVLLGLAEIVDVRIIQGDADSVTVQAGGTTIVESSMSRALSVGLDGDGNLTFSAQRVGSVEPPMDITSTVTGGSLAGVKQARDTELAEIVTKFDSYVYDVATAINTQHASGVGLDGQSGRNLFDLPSSSSSAGQLIRLSSDVAGSPDKVAAALDPTSLPGDSSNAVQLSQLGSANIVGGTRTAAEAYGDLVGQVGTKRAASKSDLQLRQAIVQQANAARESVSGVSLDEEMVNLQKYQQAYQANGKMLTVVNDLLQDLINKV